jgi:hypothetical protein
LIIPAPAPVAAQGGGGRIAFVSDRTGDDEIYVMNADGSNVTQLTSIGGDYPAWSPDGTRIAFASYPSVELSWEIYVMNADGSGQTNLTNSSTIEVYPTWSPDGSRIAFASRENHNSIWNISVMNADGSGRTTLVSGLEWAETPAWSPDGTRIAVAGKEPGLWKDFELYLVNVDGSGMTPLTQTSLTDDQPAWSPDGTRIAFAQGGLLYRDILVVNVDGSNPLILTDDHDSYNPTWSPDNTRIAFDTEVNRNRDILVMNADGSNRINLTNHIADDSDPDWWGAAAPPEPPSANARCFEETGYCIDGRIREYWEQNGGLPVFGLPIGPQQPMNIEGKTVQAQWFERNRLELHPEHAPPYDVLLGRLGADRLAQQGYDWQAVPGETAQEGCRFFEETGRNVCGDILAAWRANGLELDGQRGFNANENLALFGLPLTGLGTETTADGRELQVQYFERARFELHPENEPPFHVQLGLLGSEVRGAR